MAATATVTDVLTRGYVEVALWEDGQPGRAREVAESGELKVRRGDIVELQPASPKDERIARVAYLAPVVFFVLGMLLVRTDAWAERILTGGILGFLTWILSWLMNRRARLRRVMAWRITKIKQTKP